MDLSSVPEDDAPGFSGDDVCREESQPQLFAMPQSHLEPLNSGLDSLARGAAASMRPLYATRSVKSIIMGTHRPRRSQIRECPETLRDLHERRMTLDRMLSGSCSIHNVVVVHAHPPWVGGQLS